jgi:hypothetical protein
MSHSRRDLLLTGGALVTATAAAPLVRSGSALALAPGDDTKILSDAIALELLMAEAYQRATGALGGIARLFRNQEHAHADALTVVLRTIGGSAPKVDVSGRLNALASGGGKRGTAEALIKLEDRAVKTYVEAHRNLKDARAMQLVSSILGNQAQHLVTLRDVAGQQKVPTAFETGRN